MKVPPKRKGNCFGAGSLANGDAALNESPSEKEGKSGVFLTTIDKYDSLNESPSEKEGK